MMSSDRAGKLGSNRRIPNGLCVKAPGQKCWGRMDHFVDFGVQPFLGISPSDLLIFSHFMIFSCPGRTRRVVGPLLWFWTESVQFSSASRE